MRDPNELSFEHEATLDELAGLGKNRRFDEKIDDDNDDEIQVIYKRGDTELPLAKPSRAVYFGDRAIYDQEASLFDDGERSRILNLDQFPRNDQNFSELKQSSRHGIVIPFVGAGMSVGAGCPSWRQYMITLAGEAGLDVAALTERLDDQGDFEGVMEDVVEALGQVRFERDFQRDFNSVDLADAPIRLLPRLFGRCAITTNFDRVAEEAWQEKGQGFQEKIFGRGNTRAFSSAMAKGDRYLLKLHGNLDSPDERVLRKPEYDAAYGNDGNIHFRCALPKLLKRLYLSYSFLFIGCSLSADRTMQVFMKVAQQEGQGSLPNHYTIQPCPADDTKRRELDDRLADAHITPVWFPEGEFEYLEDILALLLD